jgi:uncharacterized hydrophobic protein (TIGR00271 family)
MNKTGHGKPFALLWKQLSEEFVRYRNEMRGEIRYQDVISELAQRTELSGSYFSSIMLANLIALFGLLTNSVAVVIGAMLISPLMGPIFSLGLAFTMGDLVLSRRALRNIAFSILLTVSVAALFTLLSPLKGATHEILSRTRPNVYDLLIAVFAGTAGALALCTRKNYLFTTTGVAVATAVIPPLSVVGYGVGTWQFGIAAGGFLLFFTNLVAIVISSDVVFYLYGFKGSMAAETVYPARRRFQILGAVLAIISIPLIITLVTDIRKVNLTRRVESILKTHLNVKQHSRLTTVLIGKDDEKFTVTASINTVKYVDSETLKKIEKELAARLGKPSNLELEQVIVRSGAVDPSTPLRTAIPAAPPPPETLAALREKALARLREGHREIETYITPYKVADCSLTFSDRGKPITVQLTIARDYPPDAQELRWLGTALKNALNETIDLKVETIPLLPTIGFTGQDQVDEPSRKALESLRQILVQLPASHLTIETPRGTRRSVPVTRRQVGWLKEYLIKELKVSEEHISVKTGNDKLTRVTIKN